MKKNVYHSGEGRRILPLLLIPHGRALLSDHANFLQKCISGTIVTLPLASVHYIKVSAWPILRVHFFRKSPFSRHSIRMRTLLLQVARTIVAMLLVKLPMMEDGFVMKMALSLANQSPRRVTVSPITGEAITIKNPHMFLSTPPQIGSFARSEKNRNHRKFDVLRMTYL